MTVGALAEHIRWQWTVWQYTSDDGGQFGSTCQMTVDSLAEHMRWQWTVWQYMSDDSTCQMTDDSGQSNRKLQMPPDRGTQHLSNEIHLETKWFKYTHTHPSLPLCVGESFIFLGVKNQPLTGLLFSTWIRVLFDSSKFGGFFVLRRCHCAGYDVGWQGVVWHVICESAWSMSIVCGINVWMKEMSYCVMMLLPPAVTELCWSLYLKSLHLCWLQMWGTVLIIIIIIFIMCSTTPWALTEYIISWRQYSLNTYTYKIDSPSVLTVLPTHNH